MTKKLAGNKLKNNAFENSMTYKFGKIFFAECNET